MVRIKKHVRITKKHPNGIIVKGYTRRKKGCTNCNQRTFQRAGFSKLSSKYLERKANGKKRR